MMRNVKISIYHQHLLANALLCHAEQFSHEHPSRNIINYSFVCQSLSDCLMRFYLETNMTDYLTVLSSLLSLTRFWKNYTPNPFLRYETILIYVILIRHHEEYIGPDQHCQFQRRRATHSSFVVRLTIT